MAGADVGNVIMFGHFQGCYTVVNSTGQDGVKQGETSLSSAKKTCVRYLRKVEKTPKIFRAVRIVKKWLSRDL